MPVRDTRDDFAVSPWGTAPTPVLPLWYREHHPDLPLPEVVQNANLRIRTIGDLGRFWESSRKPLVTRERQALAGLVGQYIPPPDQVVVPEGVNHADLVNFPLRDRTINCLRRGKLTIGHSTITVEQVMELPNFGVMSLLDLWCVMEAAHSIRRPFDMIQDKPGGVKIPAGWSFEWNKAASILEKIFVVAKEFYDAHTIKDVLTLDLYEIAKSLDLEVTANSLALEVLTNNQSYANAMVGKLQSALDGLPPRERSIVVKRKAEGETLEEVGRQMNLTRERVRQISRLAERKITESIDPELSIMARFLNKQLEPVLSENEYRKALSNFFLKIPATNEAKTIATHCLKTRLQYHKVKDMYLKEPQAYSALKQFKQASKVEADDVGIVDIDSLSKKCLDSELKKHLQQIISLCRIQNIMGYYVLRDTIKARVKIAIMEIGQPATKEEIIELSGLNIKNISNHLSNIESVARADKTRWGLADWVEDVYEGIPAEIIQRINEDGGATAVSRLLSEIPTLFDVSEVSVKAYMKTPQFVISDGYVSIADPSSIILREFDDVIDGRDENGHPYWSFCVEGRYLRGFNLLKFPPEIAQRLGCKPNGKALVPLDFPPKHRDLSISWKLSSITGASLGYLSGPLKAIRATDSDTVRLIIKGRSVELRPESKGAGKDDTSAEAILKRMKNRRRAL